MTDIINQSDEIIKYKSKIQPKIHFVYKWTNSLTGEYYIGKHSGQIDDGYIGSGKLFIIKYVKNIENWSREILYQAPSSAAALNMEKEYIGTLYKTDPLCLNLVAGGSGNYEKKLKKDELKKLIRNKEEHRHKITLNDWLESEIIWNYIYFANNAMGKHIIINTITKELKIILHHIKKYEEKYSYQILDKCFYVCDTGIRMVLNVKELITTEQEWNELKLIKSKIEELINMLKEKYNGK